MNIIIEKNLITHNTPTAMFTHIGQTKETKENPYLDQAKKLLDEAKKMHFNKSLDDPKKEETNHWDFVLAKDGTSLYKRDRKEVSPVPCYLVDTKIEKPKDDLVNKIWGVNEELAKENDPKLLMWKELEKEPSWKVCSQYSGMAWPIWPRHLVFAQTKIEEGDKTYLVAHSIDHPEEKINKNTHVEGKVCMSVYEFKDNHNGSTSIRRITQVDPKGSIPVWLINLYAGNLVDMFNRWKKD